MDIDVLLKTIAYHFAKLGADRDDVLKELNQQARRRMAHILDRYSRCVPPEFSHNGYVLKNVKEDGNCLVAVIAIDTVDGHVPAAVIRYEPAAGAADENT